MKLAELGQWWNLIFVVPFGIGLLLVTFSLIGGSNDGDADGVEGDALDGDTDGDDDGDEDSDSALQAVKAALRVPNVSLLMLLQNFLLFWGICGLTVNMMQGKGGSMPLLGVSIAAALVGGFVLTIALSSVLSRFTPRDETQVVNHRALLGRVGEAMSPITESMGSVYVRDAGGTLHHLPGRIAPGSESIAKGEQVLVIDQGEAGNHYVVKKWTVPS